MSPTTVLDLYSESHEIVRVCCYCRRVWRGERWQEPSESPQATMSHGICRECFVAHFPELPPPDELR
jgi:hypothetical protein